MVGLSNPLVAYNSYVFYSTGVFALEFGGVETARGHTVKIICDACGAKYSIADEKVSGKTFKIRCKKCSNIIVVRGASSAEASAGDVAADNPVEVWHLVVNQEQIGPMSVEDVQVRFQHGEIDASSYVWREGFEDWERISEVPEFAELVAAASVPEEAPAAAEAAAPVAVEPAAEASAPFEAEAGTGGGLFGSAEEDSSSQLNDELFGGSAAAATTTSGSGLFADQPSAVSAQTASPVSDVEASTSANVQASAAPGGDVVIASQNLKGERNESSVLFSLNNLAALAGGDAASAAPAAQTPSDTGTTEGSGLIDIRSMAQVYLGENGAAQTDVVPDLPVFTQSSFETAVPVLLPTQAEEGGNKKLLWGLIGLLVVAVGFLGFKAFSNGDKESNVAAVPSSDSVAKAPSVAPEVKTENSVVPAPEGEVEKTEAVADAVVPEPVEAVETASAIVETEERTRTKSDKRERKKDRTESRSDRAEKTKSVEAPPQRETRKSSRDSGDCDEVACLVDSSRACCKRFRSGSSSSSSGGDSKSNANLPERLSRGDIKTGMGRVRSRVASCGSKNGFKGRVDTKIKIGGNGKVSSVSAKGGSGAVNSCVSSAVKSAKFPKTQTGASFSYPWVL